MRPSFDRPLKAAIPPSSINPPTAGCQSLRILVVDDDPFAAGLMARLLVQSGHVVRTVGCVDDCLRAAAGEGFDLLITDLLLPDGSGLDLLDRIRATAPAIPPGVHPSYGRETTQGITLTGFGGVEPARASAAAGYAGHLVKPIPFEALERLIAQLFPAGGLTADLPTAG